MDTRIIVAAHKPYWMPQDGTYLPLHVGRALAAEGFGIAGDDTGDNISQRNRTFCELTGIYWAWKNLDCEAVGLCHYRRYFGHPLRAMLGGDRRGAILTGEEYRTLLDTCDVLLPVRRSYVIESVASHYAHAHSAADLEAAGRAVRDIHPGYAEAFDRAMGRRSLHILNMFVMRRPLFEEYCSWIFPVLFRLEEQIDVSTRDSYEARVFGFLAERLLNVWLEGRRPRSRTCPVVMLEPVNWLRKGADFLRRKFS